MRGIFRIQGQRSVGLVIAIFLILIVLVMLWTSQLLETVSGDDPAQTPILLILSLLFPATLLTLSAVNVFRILAQRRSGVPGSRLRLRMVGSFSLAVLVTAIPMAILSSMFLQKATDLWLAPVNGMALEAAEDMTREYHSDALARLGYLADSDYLAEIITTEKDMAIIWADVRDVAPWLKAMQVSGNDENLRMGEPSLFLSVADLEEFTAAGPLPRKISSSGTLLSWQTYIGGRRVVLSSSLPVSFETNVRTVSLARENWRRYERLRGRLSGSLAAFGLYLAGPLILMALLIGMALSERIIRPLVTLGDATRKITDGDFSFRVLAPREDELIFLTESFNSMIGELEASRTKIVQSEKVAAWQTIAQRLAHELRNPLTPIKLSAQRVQRKSLDGTLNSEILDTSMSLILREVDGLDKLLQDFREFAGGSEPKLVSLSMDVILRETVERFRTVDSSIEWNITTGAEVPLVSADVLQMRQVLVNLLKNAMEAGAQKVVCRIDLVHRGTTPYLRLQIRDDGEGIHQDRSDGVFQPYHSTRDRGSGLGLAVVQRIIYDHQGRIWFESEPGSGTVFYIDLPVGEEIT